MNKLSSEVNGIIDRLKELKISYLDLSKGEIKIDNITRNINEYQKGGFLSESSSDLFSEISPINQNGGHNLFSETSELNENNKNNLFSETSAYDQHLSNKLFSETSEFNQNGGNNLFIKKNNKNSDMYSETSELKKVYSNMDTLQSITELQDSQLDLDIFKKSIKQQKGGSINFNKKILNEIGINSSSTSSVCE
jgi:hypothetical protein